MNYSSMRCIGENSEQMGILTSGSNNEVIVRIIEIVLSAIIISYRYLTLITVIQNYSKITWLQCLGLHIGFDIFLKADNFCDSYSPL